MQIDYLQSLNIPLDNICNMMCIAPKALSLPPEHLQAVVEYVQSQGITGAYLAWRTACCHQLQAADIPLPPRQTSMLSQQACTLLTGELMHR